MVEITLKNQQKRINLNLPLIGRIAKRILQLKKIQQASLSITFVTHQKIRALNQKYLKRSYTTDVLAFNISDKNSALIGDIIISTDAAIQYSRKNKQALDREIVLYVVHGLLHLLGYDDHNPKDAEQMRNMEKRLLDLVKRSIPDVIQK